MKCVKAVSDNSVVRVSDDKASKLVATGAYVYCPKKEWKEATQKS